MGLTIHRKQNRMEQPATVTLPMTKLRGFLEFAAGAAIGLLVGFIAGLSISPVVATILGALSTSLLILLGLKESKDPTTAVAHAIRVLGFGFFCSISLIAGILFRTYGVLSPPLVEQKRHLAEVNVFTPAEIDQILLLTNYGLQSVAAPASSSSSVSEVQDRKAAPDQKSAQSVKESLDKKANTNPGQVQPATAALASAGLLRAGSAEFCQAARRENFSSVGEYVDELRRWDARLAHFIESVPTESRDQVSKSLSKSLCP
jgi:hypothetical protein